MKIPSSLFIILIRQLIYIILIGGSFILIIIFLPWISFIEEIIIIMKFMDYFLFTPIIFNLLVILFY